MCSSDLTVVVGAAVVVVVVGSAVVTVVVGAAVVVVGSASTGFVVDAVIVAAVVAGTSASSLDVTGCGPVDCAKSSADIRVVGPTEDDQGASSGVVSPAQSPVPGSAPRTAVDAAGDVVGAPALDSAASVGGVVSGKPSEGFDAAGSVVVVVETAPATDVVRVKAAAVTGTTLSAVASSAEAAAGEPVS